MNALEEFVKMVKKSAAMRSNFEKFMTQNKKGKQNLYNFVGIIIKLLIFRFQKCHCKNTNGGKSFTIDRLKF